MKGRYFMKRIVLIDGNSILNRAFYGIMGNNMLKTEDGTYTNAVFGFLQIMFKILENIEPGYMAVAFDMKSPTFRHKMFGEYKGTRKGMPEELAAQLPIIKEVLNAMNIKIIEKEGYEADDILGTLAKRAGKKGFDVTILSGDRDTFQLATDKITIRIPRTKAGKTEEEDFDRVKILEVYGIEPRGLIEVKGLMGDNSDNIPGVAGVGEKTALWIIKEFKTIDKLYEELENGRAESVKGKLREKLIAGKELAYLSKTLGTINTDSPIDVEIEDLKRVEWNNKQVYDIFSKLRFNKFIDKFSLRDICEEKDPFDEISIKENLSEEELNELVKKIQDDKKIIYFLDTKDIENEEKIIKKEIISLSIIIENVVYFINNFENIKKYFKDIFESNDIKKIGYKLKQDFILLKQNDIELKGIEYDAEIAGYVLDSTRNKYDIDTLALRYLNLEVSRYIKTEEKKQEQLDLFSMPQEETSEVEADKQKSIFYVYAINKMYPITMKQIEEQEELELFERIEMPTASVLAKMQYNGIYLDKEELTEFGRRLKLQIEEKTEKIYQICGQKFNINSPKQLGKVLFEDLKLPILKKKKTGYSTDGEILEKLRNEHQVISEILEYRQLVKLNSTYVDGVVVYINKKTNRIHSYFHQTVTATGRISSTEPNLQNIPTRTELGKRLRKVFKPQEGCIFVDADYSQVELRVFAHISQDEKMINAFKNGIDIHREVAARVLGKKLEEVTSAERTSAKAVNFGIVYGISDFGLSEQLGVSVREAKEYIESYLRKYNGIKKFMDNIKEEAKEKGYVTTMFGRRRYLPELQSQNFMIRQFGARAAINMPIQGTAADIMKLAMIEVQKQIEKQGLKTKLVLQIHDELLLEVPRKEEDIVKEILKQSMENVVELLVPLIAEVSTGNDWSECK